MPLNFFHKIAQTFGRFSDFFQNRNRSLIGTAFFLLLIGDNGMQSRGLPAQNNCHPDIGTPAGRADNTCGNNRGQTHRLHILHFKLLTQDVPALNMSGLVRQHTFKLIVIICLHQSARMHKHIVSVRYKGIKRIVLNNKHLVSVKRNMDCPINRPENICQKKLCFFIRNQSNGFRPTNLHIKKDQQQEKSRR